MLIEEAKWLGEYICSLEENCFPVLNVGSSTEEFRKHVQPYIDEYIFKPLENQNKRIIHTDIKDGKGVDMVGDLNDMGFIEKLRETGARSILCSNLLEHIEYPQQLCLQLEKALERGGTLIITVPYIYPYHKDPVDTKFRPSIEQLSGLFPHCRIITGKYVSSQMTQAKKLLKHIRKGQLLDVFNIAKKWFFPFHGREEWLKAVSDIPNLFKSYQVTCIVLKKK